MDRSQQLLQKIQQINNNFNTKNNKYITASTDSLESKLEIIKKKMQIVMEKNKQQVNNLMKDASELYQKVQKNNRQYECEAKLQIQKLKGIQQKFTKRLEIQILQRKERENSIIQSFQEKATYLKKQIQKQRKIRQSLFAQVTSTLQDDLPSIMTQLNEAKLQFDHDQEQTNTHCEGLLNQCEKYVKQFNTEQQANSNKAFDLIKDLTKKIKLEIQQEKTACEATHEEVFAYVEETCSKLAQR